jgi:hypothetical protein
MEEEKLNEIMSAILKLEGEWGKLIIKEMLLDELREIPREEVEKGLKKLKDSCSIFEPREGYFRRF